MIGYSGPRRHAQNAPDAVTVADGPLTIATFTEGGVHSTGFIDTAGRFLATYGWFEARVRFESSPGEWGAFWLQSPTMGTPVDDVGSAGVSHRPEFIKLTYEVRDASWAGAIPAGGYGPRGRSTTRMRVDWVRVWQATRP